MGFSYRGNEWRQREKLQQSRRQSQRRGCGHGKCAEVNDHMALSLMMALHDLCQAQLGVASAAPAPNVAVAANEAPAPVVAGEVRDGEVVNLRGNLKVLLPQDVALGCPKCRNSRVGCQTCRVAKGLRLIGGFWDCF